ncbi:MAG: TolC family protein [Muribaculaceae bacterium]|nr:TolC family protein [Muribaculaceae bacterium]
MKQQLFLIVALIISLPSPGSETRDLLLTLDDAIVMARKRSVASAVALDELRTAYWEWRTYLADRLPEITFTATAPSYSDRYSPYMNEEGNYSFVRSHSLDVTGQLSVSQNIPLTGGKLQLTSSFDYLYQYGIGGGNRFMTIPLALSLTQPVFGVNTLRWRGKIEPVRYAEAKAAFMSATEDVALATVSLFFNLILSRENLAMAGQNLNNARKLYAVAQEKRTMGRISKNDLLQMELNVLDAEAEFTQCESQVKSNMFALRSHLDLDSDTQIIPVLPSEIPVAAISYDQALTNALTNNKFAYNIRRRQLEADYEVAKAKGDMRSINLFAQIGYTGTDAAIGGAYTTLRSNRVVEVGLSIPLVDWGKRRGKVKVAESNRKVTESRLRQESMDFRQELYVLVERFGKQRRQLAIAKRANEIARQRYETNVETYLIGMISTLDLNDSQQRKDESMRNYINELYIYWNYWYQIRSVTLYDYQADTPIDNDVARLVK